VKVSLDTVEITDEQREQLANVLDGKVSKRKATRAEAKEFIWHYGDTWAETLTDMVNDSTGTPEDDAEDDDDEDLIGDSSELDDLL
jgi:hypothetical protein